MYIANISIENFRGFSGKKVIELNEKLNIFIGHNNSGKTTVIKALQILFDTSYSKKLSINDFNRQLSINDLKANPPQVVISSILKENEGEAEYSEDIVLVSTMLTKIQRPYEAKITYEFFLPEKEIEEYRATMTAISSPNIEEYWSEIEHSFLSKYVWKLYGGDEKLKTVVDNDILNKFDFEFMQPIRDVERDLSSGSDSLLKEVIDFFIDYEIKNDTSKTKDEIKGNLQKVKREFAESSQQLMTKLQGRLTAGEKQIVTYADDTGATFDESSPHFSGVLNETTLYSALRLTLEDKTGIKLPPANNGLGYNNLIYIALLLARMQKDAMGEYYGSNAKLFSVLAIEEPEAHLHPSLQYRFLKFLNDNMKSNVRQIFISTHSPNITAASKLDNLIVLNKEKEEIEVAYPGRVFDLKNKDDKASKAYIERYLDVTKSDMLFAKRIILVEGISEQLLLPIFTRYLNGDLVDSHVAVINIGGRYFSHFLKLFDRDKSEYAINKRVAVITDLDPVRKKAGVKGARFCSCYPFELSKDSGYEYKASSNLIADLYSDRKKSISVFTQTKDTGCTFEYDLLLHNPTCKELIVPSITNGDILLSLMNNYAKKYEEMVAAVGDSDECKRIKDGLADSKNKDQLIAALYLLYVSKAESAQEIAEVLSEKEAAYLKGAFSFKIPPYIEGAIKWVLE
ncbi:AAA family ATPase [Clostridium sp. KNHs216]|uniref:ATP-dependent nuclease n=1 Tax=Clostridium sp. KNHs216 TaxID=1550235 RepID=UPI00114E897E|nr:AAA family ATPase [Clostridium sp. KNHs216]TQI67338.1 putative ATP-dependent endonuclease of OLD family [Clostridium sp. KNHs216]